MRPDLHGALTWGSSHTRPERLRARFAADASLASARAVRPLTRDSYSAGRARTPGASVRNRTSRGHEAFSRVAAALPHYARSCSTRERWMIRLTTRRWVHHATGLIAAQDALTETPSPISARGANNSQRRFSSNPNAMCALPDRETKTWTWVHGVSAPESSRSRS